MATAASSSSSTSRIFDFHDELWPWRPNSNLAPPPPPLLEPLTACPAYLPGLPLLSMVELEKINIETSDLRKKMNRVLRGSETLECVLELPLKYTKMAMPRNV